jgi:hypothetical protein
MSRTNDIQMAVSNTATANLAFIGCLLLKIIGALLPAE